MRVLQLIDSLDAGGAERLAVTYANVFPEYVEHSFICASRKEGVLKEKIKDNVTYFFLNKKSTLDIKAIFALRRLLKRHKINVVHAHSTSYFLATLVKILRPSTKLVWHEHHGNRVSTTRMDNKALYLCSFFFNRIVVVNQALAQWCQTHLAKNSATYVPNIVPVSSLNISHKNREKSIVCLANLRIPKDHLNLIKAFQRTRTAFPDWKLQLIGKDNDDTYSRDAKEYIYKNALKSSVEILGVRSNTEQFLEKATIGVLSSSSEGLPMALLEYGAFGLAVIATNVGDCGKVIGTFGKVVPSKDEKALSDAMLEYMRDVEHREKDSYDFHTHIKKVYSPEAVLPELIKIYKS